MKEGLKQGNVSVQLSLMPNKVHCLCSLITFPQVENRNLLIGISDIETQKKKK